MGEWLVVVVEPATPVVAERILNPTQAMLDRDHYAACQSAFGWFNRLEG